jgi:hypothetical protein
MDGRDKPGHDENLYVMPGSGPGIHMSGDA